MLSYLLNNGVIVSLNSAHSDQLSKVAYQGAEAKAVRRVLYPSVGLLGHMIGDRTTPIDLARAMKTPKMQQFEPQLLQGAELLTSVPRIPPGAKS